MEHLTALIPGDLSLWSFLWELVILRAEGRQRLLVLGPSLALLQKPEMFACWLTKQLPRMASREAEPLLCLQGGTGECRGKLATSLPKAITESTFRNWICAQNILNTSEACFVELILALEMFLFYSYLRFWGFLFVFVFWFGFKLSLLICTI